jgi:PAS domain S-box-containing protein
MKNIISRLSPFKIALFYACIGGLWLLLNISMLVANLVLERDFLHAIEIQSVLLILVTSWVLYVLIVRTRSDSLSGKLEPLNRLVRALKAYSECHQSLIRATDEKQLMNDICRIFIEVGGYRMAWVGLAADDAERTITPVAGWGENREFVEIFKSTCMNRDLGNGPIKTAIKTGKPVVLQHQQKDVTCEVCRIRCLQQGFCSSIFLPLSNQTQTFAALMIYSSGADTFDDEEVTLLTNLASDLSYGITALRVAAANKEAEKQRHLLASVIVQMRSGLYLLDNMGTIEYVNPAAEKISGYTATELVGSSIRELFSGESERRICEAIQQQLSAPADDQLARHFQHVRKDGAVFELDLATWTVTDNEGGILNYVAMVRDITHEQQLENQLRRAQRMEAIGILAGGIAHDFNNALASIITCTELALDTAEAKSSSLKELLEVVLKSGQRGKELVRQILTFSRQTEQERQEVKVDLIVKECLKMLRSTLTSSIEIRLQIEQRLGVVFADPTQVHQIVMNLCTNAIHAINGKGHGVLELELETCELDQVAAAQFVNLLPGSYLRLTVRDNGHGMNEATLEKIFDPFFSTKGLTEGTGLGLSVIHGIITRLGGTITVESKPDQGTRFDVYLPRREEEISRHDEVEQKLFQPHGNNRILLVDDDENLLFSVDLLLRQLGYTVVAQNKPQHALELFQADPSAFDLVITDQAMPEMNGIELASQLAQIRPGIPIILCTGYDPTAGYGADTNGQIADYITELAIKPLERHELLAVLARVLNGLPKRGTD